MAEPTIYTGTGELPAFRGAYTWSSRVSGEGSNERKRRIVNATPAALRLAAKSGIAPAIRQDWLAALVEEQQTAERIIQAKGLPEPEAWERQNMARGVCGGLWHATETGRAPTITATLGAVPGLYTAGWRPLSFKCQECKRTAGRLFLVERDTVYGEWLRITNAAPYPVSLLFDGSHRIALDPLDTWDCPSVFAAIESPYDNRGTITRRWSPPGPTVTVRATSIGVDTKLPEPLAIAIRSVSDAAYASGKSDGDTDLKTIAEAVGVEGREVVPSDLDWTPDERLYGQSTLVPCSWCDDSYAPAGETYCDDCRPEAQSEEMMKAAGIAPYYLRLPPIAESLWQPIETAPRSGYPIAHVEAWNGVRIYRDVHFAYGGGPWFYAIPDEGETSYYEECYPQPSHWRPIE